MNISKHDAMEWTGRVFCGAPDTGRADDWLRLRGQPTLRPDGRLDGVGATTLSGRAGWCAVIIEPDLGFGVRWIAREWVCGQTAVQFFAGQNSIVAVEDNKSMMESVDVMGFLGFVDSGANGLLGRLG